MSRESADVRDLVNEVEQGFDALRTEARAFYEQVHFSKAYQDLLVSAFAPEITTRIPYPSARLDHSAWQTEGILRVSRQFHVEAASKLKGDEKVADKLELFFAHAMEVRMNQGGKLWADTYRHQCVSPFAAWWMEWDAFQLPTEESERQAYRESYWPFRLSVVHPLTVGFRVDDTGQPTVATRNFELPYVELAKRYGEHKKGEDFKPLKILGEQYPFLRGGSGRAVESSEIFGKKATVWVVDDGNTICHYCEIKAGGKKGYENLTKEVASPWAGRTSLQLITGRYNDEAETLAERYRPLLWDLGREQKNVDTLHSQAVSIALTPTLWVEVIPKEGISDGVSIEPTKLTEGQITPVRGQMQSVGQQLLPPVIDMLNGAKEARDALLPAPFLTTPDPVLIKEGTASGILTANETSSRAYDESRSSVLTGIKDVCKRLVAFVDGGGAKSSPGYKNEGIGFTVTGTEVTKKYRGAEKGRDVMITPDDVKDFDQLYTLEVNVIASTASQKKANYDIVRQEVVDGANTIKGLIETTTEDVEGRVMEIHEETRYQALLPVAMKMDLLGYAEWMRLSEGRDPSLLLQASGLLGAGPEAVGQAPGELAQGGDGFTVNAPPTAVPDVAAVG